MIMAFIGLIIGWMIWITGIMTAVLFVRDVTANKGEKFWGVIACVLLSFCLGMIFACDGIFKPQRDTLISYETPTSIVKTNNLTMVNHISDGGRILASLVSGDAMYWNGTNIMIKITNGQNFYGYDVESTYKVVLKE